ncbi:MBL fold metallo-hydrolase [Brevibacillus migulae]|uniref:MBL fold metallo-hydrolase n=1 Tax=Brevibacillus migulae TaxID=1644114 RepID=UPI00106EC13D|nr:MBL fold metallo-hydrolase [Brevibacillus migulae]
MIQFSQGHITVYQSALFQTTSTVIALDEAILIVDPTWLPSEIREIQAHVDSIKGSRDCYLLFTHGDYDHVIGYQAFPGAKTIGSLELQRHPQKERKVNLIREFDANYYITRDYPIEFPQLDFVIAQDGQQLAIGNTSLTFYKAPGHSEDSLFTIIDSLGVFIAGDYLSDFELPFIYHSAAAYESTMQRAAEILQNHDIRLLIPGHGQHTTNRSEMFRRIHLATDHLRRLKEAVIHGDEAALEKLGEEHAFPSSFTKECHEENIRIMRREYMGELAADESIHP